MGVSGPKSCRSPRLSCRPGAVPAKPGAPRAAGPRPASQPGMPGAPPPQIPPSLGRGVAIPCSDPRPSPPRSQTPSLCSCGRKGDLGEDSWPFSGYQHVRNDWRPAPAGSGSGRVSGAGTTFPRTHRAVQFI